MKYALVLFFSLICVFEIFSQTDSIIVSIENDNSDIQWEDIIFYDLESDGIWRARYDSGKLISDAEFKNFFVLKCFCKRRLLHGLVMSYNACGIVESISVYKKGKWVRIVYPKMIASDCDDSLE